jgi:folate-binding protein YgfZ
MCLKDWTDLEIDLSHSWISSENSQVFLPQSLNYHEIDALDFEKGCYLGQEIIARMHFRGKLKKRLHLINEPIVGLKDGVLISQGRKKTLAVLKNTSGQPIEVMNQENRRVLAQPI